MRSHRTLRVAVAAVLGVALSAGLVACVQPEPTPTSTASRAPTKSPTPTPAPTLVPKFWPEGTAVENLPYFNYINEQSYAAYGFVDGIVYVDALTNAGFDRSQMELTWWDTPDGHLADSIFFSVRFAGECLLGQIANWGYQGSVVPILSTGSCMVGDYLQPIP